MLNAVPVTDDEQPWDGLVSVVELMICLFEFALALIPPIAPPTIAPITVKTTRPVTAAPFFVCQKG